MPDLDEDGDAREALEPDDDFDPDEAELKAVVLAGEDLDEPRSFARSAADRARDRDLEQTFPASDAVSPNPGTD